MVKTTKDRQPRQGVGRGVGGGRPPGLGLPRAENSDFAYGRRLNNRARAIIHSLLDELTNGNAKDFKGHGAEGEHGRTFIDQLRYQLWCDPRGTIAWINDVTPCDEGEPGRAGAAVNVGTVYLQALQLVNGAKAPGAIGVQGALSDW